MLKIFSSSSVHLPNPIGKIRFCSIKASASAPVITGDNQITTKCAGDTYSVRKLANRCSITMA